MKDRQYDAVARIDEADFDNDSTFNSRIIIKINQVCQQTYAFVEINGRNCIGNAVGQGGMERPVKDDKAVERSSATAGFPDKVRGQAVVAYVVPEDDSLTVSDLMKHCADSPMLSIYKAPRYYALVSELPHTATGKKMHYVMKQRAVRDLENGVLKRS